MKLLQSSFTAGEISPLLHARVDLAKYMTAVKDLTNFIVLPQGGITRRTGFCRWSIIDDDSGKIRLIPFQYDIEDTGFLKLTPGALEAIVAKMSATGEYSGLSGIGVKINSPYGAGDLDELKYVQSGNVIFFAHRNHPVQMLVRYAGNDWRFEEFETENMPILSGSGKSDESQSVLVYHLRGGSLWYIVDPTGQFSDLRYGDVFRIDLPIGGKIEADVPAKEKNNISRPIIVKGTWEFATAGKDWAGKIYIEKSFDNGKNWFLVKAYEKQREEDGQNTLMNGVETEDDMLYRVRVDMADNDIRVLSYTFIANTFIKPFEFIRLGPYAFDPDIFHAKMITDTNGVDYVVNTSEDGVSYDNIKDYAVEALDWGAGAWSSRYGYPGAAAFYQDRLVLAGSVKEPQTVWMSKTGDYKDFGTSDPVRDDDGITVTLAGDSSDRIHSLLSMTDLLAFTASGEWKISGAGENGSISPKAVTALQQTTIGSKNIQPIAINNSVILVQTGGMEAHALGYNLNIDGYAGSEISILSEHLFSPDRQIIGMAYQQVPYSLLWFVLSDGTMATCTYNPEHEVIGWARQTTEGKAAALVCTPNRGETILSAFIFRDSGQGYLEYMRLYKRAHAQKFVDFNGVSIGAVPYAWKQPYASSVELLRINYGDEKNGISFPSKKLISRVSVYALESKEAWAAPGPGDPLSKRRKIKWAESAGMQESNIQLDAGFEKDANLRIWVDGEEPLTILAVAPYVTGGA